MNKIGKFLGSGGNRVIWPIVFAAAGSVAGALYSEGYSAFCAGLM